MGRCVRTSCVYSCSRCLKDNLAESDFNEQPEEVDEVFYDFDNMMTYSELEHVPEHDECERIVVCEGVCLKCDEL